MTDLRQAAKQALEALESLQGGCTDHNDGTVEAITVWCPEVIDALRTALEQPEPVTHLHEWFRTGAMEPGKMRCIHCGAWGNDVSLTTPPAAQRKPLTNHELEICIGYRLPDAGFDAIRELIKAAHSIR